METTEYFNDSDGLVYSDVNSTLNNVTGTNGTVPVPRIYCGHSWTEFRNVYGGIHGYLSLAVCFFGCLANLLNLIVLTRKVMINPTNAILTGLALADLLNMIEYIPFAIYKISPDKNYPYGWALFILVHSNFSQVVNYSIEIFVITCLMERYDLLEFS